MSMESRESFDDWDDGTLDRRDWGRWLLAMGLGGVVAESTAAAQESAPAQPAPGSAPAAEPPKAALKPPQAIEVLIRERFANVLTAEQIQVVLQGVLAYRRQAAVLRAAEVDWQTGPIVPPNLDSPTAQPQSRE
ncbi:hypothetical protein [Tuwongella immobilis]|uniref:Uncharacterized protein n=1 Tax=Tuwongella immobilis TaxID=692036 RepID=A0A6C2YRL1_9BACT|nr:hypothetical protein [Tuwongella immobilis]VIP04126.1 unnamed protein product [Tuwongella immobilis]VTS05617.1 unnamed protein product [Tuwongella immobilis]